MFAPIPLGHVAWSDRRLRGAWVALGLTAAVALAFLPDTLINNDEYLYAGQARMLLHGRVSPLDGDPIPAPLDHPDATIRYPIGWPLLLALGAVAGFRAMFLVPLAMHLIAGAVVARMLVRRGRPSWLVAVYLFHPVFWSYSRTMTSDVPTVAVALLAMDGWEERAGVRTALASGYALLMRLASGFTLLGFGLAILPELRARWREAVGMVVAATVACAAVLGVNVLVHGDPFRSPYTHGSASLLSPSMLGENAILYGAGLLLIPPCPLLCLFISPRRCERWALAVVPILLFFLAYAYHENSQRVLETFLGGQRLILAAHAILLVATVAIWSAFPLLRWPAPLLLAGVLTAVTELFLTRHLEERYAPVARALRACRPDAIAFNTHASRVVLSTDAPSYHLIDEREPVGQGDVAVVATRMPTNRAMTVEASYELPPSLLGRLSTSCRQFGEFYLFDLTGRCPPLGGTPCSPPLP
jgi:hypothetical protein